MENIFLHHSDYSVLYANLFSSISFSICVSLFFDESIFSDALFDVTVDYLRTYNRVDRLVGTE